MKKVKKKLKQFIFRHFKCEHKVIIEKEIRRWEKYEGDDNATILYKRYCKECGITEGYRRVFYN